MEIGTKSKKKGNPRRKTGKTDQALINAKQMANENTRASQGAAVFILADGKRRTHLVKSRCTGTIDGQKVRLRYIEGVKDIIDGKQGDVSGVKAKSIRFHEGKLVTKDEALIAYLEANPKFGRDYVRYDAVKEATEKVANEKKLYKAMFYANEGLDSDQAFKLARLLRMPNVTTAAEAQIRSFLGDYARGNTENFVKLIDSPEADINNDLLNAFDSGFLEVRDGGLCYSGGGEIFNLPRISFEGQLEEVVRWIMTNKEGAEFHKVIKDDKK